VIELKGLSLPDGFDREKHQRALARMVADQYGTGSEIDSIDMGTRSAP
tara:strand:- start:297 stop:440 length:144 start_codon:yes stop_codon:yes gene_type:complete